MIRIYNQFLNRWLSRFEICMTIIWLLYFFGVALPEPFPKNINMLSYPLLGILILLQWKRLLWIATRDIPLLMVVATVLASIFWSQDLTRTLEASRGLVRMFLFGAYFASRYSFSEQMKILCWVFGLSAVLSLISVILIPGYGLSEVHIGAWKGIFGHKGMLGDVMSIGSILCLLTALKTQTKNWLAWLGFGLMVAINVLTDSASSLISLLILLSLMPLYKFIKQKYRLKTILITLVCILFGLSTVLIISNLDTILINVLEQSTDGRLSIWTLMNDKIFEERPWTGYGFNAFWSSDAGTFVGRYAWSEPRVAGEFNSHSSYMEIFASLGYLGILFYGISLITVLMRSFLLLMSTPKIEFFWAIQFLVFAHIAAIANVGKILSGASSYWVIYVAICLSTAVEYRRLNRQQLKSIKKQEFSLTQLN